jgi:predicted XRE-type DNA-binding protein
MRRENQLSHADTGGQNKALTLEKANELAEKFSKLPENVLQLIQAECSQIEEDLESLPLGESSTSELGDIKFTYPYQKDKLTNLLFDIGTTLSSKEFVGKNREYKTTEDDYFWKKKDISEALATYLASCGLDVQVQTHESGTPHEWNQLIVKNKQ